ncbi:MAG: URC4/urg3 family protein [Burkholderiaceae bacterium]|nr:URC4/urg3 family protein [Burkholderiaceae bacterium]
MSEIVVAAPHGRDAVSVLRDPATIRRRCAAITRAVSEGRSANFKLDRSRLDEVAARIERVTRAAYPDLQIPFHSRWRHFESGGVDRKASMDAQLADRSVEEQARARFDLTVVSVLLDAGAGPDWRYVEADSGQTYSRSEGLGVASWHAFQQGLFSGTPGDPLRADAAALQRLDVDALRHSFQVTASNPLVGLEGRVALLNRLGSALAADHGVAGRPGTLFDRLTRPDREEVARREVGAGQVLRAVLDAFSSIWLTGGMLQGIPLGDVWHHRWAGGESKSDGGHGTTDDWVPFHKLSQWLSYSLLEPLMWAGVRVTGLDALTGLPEYRNGGLLIDGGVIVPRDPRNMERRWKPGDEFIVEWRALTVSLIDELAPLVRARLGKSIDEMPLACILEGGTWAAGREIARELRDGSPPLLIDSDGTVF